MMNYLWGGLILISMVFAVGGDLYDISQDAYENDREYVLGIENDSGSFANNQTLAVVLKDVAESQLVTYKSSGERAQLRIDYSENLPEQWKRRFGTDTGGARCSRALPRGTRTPRAARLRPSLRRTPR